MNPSANYSPFTINVETDPGGVDLFVDGTALYPGRYRGTTNEVTGLLTVNIPSLRHGLHTLTLRKPGYADYVYYFTSSAIFASLSLTGPSAVKMFWHIQEKFTSQVVLTVDKTEVADGGALDVGTDAAPTVADLDFTGTRDLIVGDGTGGLRLFRNYKDYDSGTDFGLPEKLGTVSCKDGSKDGVPGGEFNECARLNSGNTSKPFIVDWNNDGLFDLLVGSSDGRVYIFWGIHDRLVPFNLPREVQSFCYIPQFLVDLNPFDPLNGGYASPFVADYDNDHDKDLLVGSANNHLYIFRNIGGEADFTAPVLDTPVELRDPNNFPFGASNRVNPFVSDIDYDGAPDLMIADQNQVRFLRNLNPPHLEPLFISTTAVQAEIQPLNVSSYIRYCGPGLCLLDSNNLTAVLVDMSPNVADNLSSGYFMRDLLVGMADGQIRAFRAKHIDGDIDPGNGSATVDGPDLIKLNQCLGAVEGDPAYNPLCDIGLRDSNVDLGDRADAEGNFGEYLDACGNGLADGICLSGTGAGTACSYLSPCPGGAECSEECDDGNNENLDGCNSECRHEICTPIFTDNFASDANWTVSSGIPVANQWQYLGPGLGFQVNWAGALDQSSSYLTLNSPLPFTSATYMEVQEDYQGTAVSSCSIENSPAGELRARSCSNPLAGSLKTKRFDMSAFGGQNIILRFRTGGLFGGNYANETSAWQIRRVEVGNCIVP